MLTNIDFDGIAEDYLGCFETWKLKEIAKDGIDLSVLKDWVASECEVIFSEDDFEELNNSIMGFAEQRIEDVKREAAYELTSSIDNVINDYCGCLEDEEVAAIFMEYASRYLPNRFN